MGSWSLVAVVVAASMLLGVAGWALGAPTMTEVATAPVARVEAPGQDLVVHVGGAVARPGLVILPEGARVADAIRGAGGLLTDAAVDAVNLARPLADGEQVVVPRVGPSATGIAEPGVISVNTATAAELEELPGVGPVLAGRIVDHREAVGRFETVEDLLGVPGIGERMLASLRDLVRVP